MADTDAGAPSGLPTALNDQLCFALYAATNAIQRIYGPMLDDLALTYPQYLILLALWQDGDQSIEHLAATLRVPAERATTMVEGLVEAGIAEWVPDPGEHGAVLVAATRHASGLAPAVARAQYQVACATTLDDEQVGALRSTLHDLVDRMDAAVAG